MYHAHTTTVGAHRGQRWGSPGAGVTGRCEAPFGCSARATSAVNHKAHLPTPKQELKTKVSHGGAVSKVKFPSTSHHHTKVSSLKAPQENVGVGEGHCTVRKRQVPLYCQTKLQDPICICPLMWGRHLKKGSAGDLAEQWPSECVN